MFLPVITKSPLVFLSCACLVTSRCSSNFKMQNLEPLMFFRFKRHQCMFRTKPHPFPLCARVSARRNMMPRYLVFFPNPKPVIILSGRSNCCSPDHSSKSSGRTTRKNHTLHPLSFLPSHTPPPQVTDARLLQAGQDEKKMILQQLQSQIALYDTQRDHVIELQQQLQQQVASALLQHLPPTHVIILLHF